MIRCKFRLDEIRRTCHGNDQETLSLFASPVTATKDPNDENSRFWRWTPSGKLELQATNLSIKDELALGKEFYLDLTPIPPPQQ